MRDVIRVGPDMTCTVVLFSDLRCGDAFKLYEEPGEAVVVRSQYLSIAASNPPDNNYTKGNRLGV